MLNNTIPVDPLGDGISQLQLVDFMGGELAIVNDARASFNKQSTELTDKDKKLIKYLITHKHYSPLRSTVFKFKAKVPLYISRQWWKHTVASSYTEQQQSWSEQSLRYIDLSDKAEFYIPREFRKQSSNNKQATDGLLNPENNQLALDIYTKLCGESYMAYEELIKLGVGREQARGVLVPSVYTTFVWTVSLQALLNFLELRLGEGAQSEIVAYAQAIKDIITPLVPTVLEAYN